MEDMWSEGTPLGDLRGILGKKALRVKFLASQLVVTTLCSLEVDYGAAPLR